MIRATVGFTAQTTALPEREPVPASLLAKVAALPGIQALWATVQGYAAMVDKTGKAIAPGGLPTIGASWGPGDVLDVGRAPRAGRGGDRPRHRAALSPASGRQDQGPLRGRHGGLHHRRACCAGSADAAAATRAIFDPTRPSACSAKRARSTKSRCAPSRERAPPRCGPASTPCCPAATRPSHRPRSPTRRRSRGPSRWGSYRSPCCSWPPSPCVVGALLIGNTFSILVGQRTRELGLLRALGASRAQLRRLVLVEALALGVSASLTGILLGFGLAHGLLALVRDVGLAVPSTSVVFRVRSCRSRRRLRRRRDHRRRLPARSPGDVGFTGHRPDGPGVRDGPSGSAIE